MPEGTSWQLLVGAGLTILVVVWLMILVSVTVIRKEPIHIPAGQYGIIKFLCTIAAATGGWLLSGDLAISATGQVDTNLKLLASGGGAAGLALLVWLTFPNRTDTQEQKVEDGLNAEIPADWTFHQAATFVAEKFDGTLSVAEFSKEELTTVIGKAVKVQGSDGKSCLLQLNKFLPSKVRKFDISFDRAMHEYKLIPRK